MRNLYWYKTCPFCNQGRLFVFKNLDINKLYFHCEECERGYYNPNLLDKEHAFLTITEDFEAIEATKEDIIDAQWDKLGLHLEVI
jgi:hypothetical protein